MSMVEAVRALASSEVVDITPAHRAAAPAQCRPHESDVQRVDRRPHRYGHFIDGELKNDVAGVLRSQTPNIKIVRAAVDCANVASSTRLRTCRHCDQSESRPDRKTCELARPFLDPREGHGENRPHRRSQGFSVERIGGGRIEQDTFDAECSSDPEDPADVIRIRDPFECDQSSSAGKDSRFGRLRPATERETSSVKVDSRERVDDGRVRDVNGHIGMCRRFHGDPRRRRHEK